VAAKERSGLSPRSDEPMRLPVRHQALDQQHKTPSGGKHVPTERSRRDKMQLDLYYLGLDRKDGAFQGGTALEVANPSADEYRNPLRANILVGTSTMMQSGNSATSERQKSVPGPSQRRRATGFPRFVKPRFSAEAAISSGDHSAKDTLGTFSPLYPKGNYFGVLSTTSPGPINFVDVHPHVEASAPHNLLVSLDWIFQWRQSLDDGVYAVPGFLIRAADGRQVHSIYLDLHSSERAAGLH
jgi:hypothetical protein